MKILIKLTGFLSETGLPNGYKGGQLEVVKGTTLAQVLAQLQIPDQASWVALVNGRHPSRQTLEEDDVIQLVPRIGGG